MHMTIQKKKMCARNKINNYAHVMSELQVRMLKSLFHVLK